MEDNSPEKPTIVYRIEIDKEVWSEFKKQTDKSMTMNERICKLIYKETGIPYPDKKVEQPKKTKRSPKK